MTEQEFIDYIVGYGTHVQFLYGGDIIQKTVHLTPQNSNYSIFPQVSNGSRYHMEFNINGNKATIKECADLITRYKRDKILTEVGI
jgi:hypothetical protein